MTDPKPARRYSTRLAAACATALCALSASFGAAAQESSGSSYPTVGLGGNFGFQKLSSSNGLFEVGADIPIYFTEDFSVGPWMQLGVGQSTVNLIVTANARYAFDFLERTRFNEVEPFVQGGLGLAYTRFAGAGATDFVMNMGFGAEVPVNDHVYVGSDVMFNPILTRPTGGNWAFTWQFVTLRYRF